jgi:RNA polymerase sigma-70 factor (ECF subfamily)
VSFNCLVLASQDMIFQHAVWMLGEPEAAEEITQETFLQAYRERYSFQAGDFCCWLFGIASRLCRAELHRQESKLAPFRKKKGSEIDLETEFGEKNRPGSTERNTGQDDLELAVRAGLMGFSPDLRAVLTLVDLQGFDYRQAAEILGMPVRMVISYLTRARVQIQDGLLCKRPQNDGAENG